MPGYDADLVILNNKLEIDQVISMGVIRQVSQNSQ
jgi:N-acetylglucosamine-6-phosphate deacetylase